MLCDAVVANWLGGLAPPLGKQPLDRSSAWSTPNEHVNHKCSTNVQKHNSSNFGLVIRKPLR